MLDNFNLPNETIDKVYNDGLHPVVSESGKLIARLPRIINAALSSLDQWISQKEYNVEATKKSLEMKLSSIDAGKIVPPEPYVAIPAFQSISYCISSKELYNLYSNLLSKAMFEDTKDKVHPALVEIIKQLSPNDALILSEINSRSHAPLPSATLSIVLKIKGLHYLGQMPQQKVYLDVITDLHVNNLSNEQISVSVDNLKRLGIISFSDHSLENISDYDFVKQSEHYNDVSNEFNSLVGTDHDPDYIHINRSCYYLTPLGRLFCDICINEL